MEVTKADRLVFVIDDHGKIEMPPEVRERFNVGIGQKVAWMPVGNTYRLVRVVPLQELRGTLPAFDWSDYRDETDRDL